MMITEWMGIHAPHSVAGCARTSDFVWTRVCLSHVRVKTGMYVVCKCGRELCDWSLCVNEEIAYERVMRVLLLFRVRKIEQTKGGREVVVREPFSGWEHPENKDIFSRTIWSGG